MKNLLLLTATISPRSDVHNMARVDPQVRRRDYEVSLRHYLDPLEKGIFDGLVFAENSDSDLGSLRRIVADAGLSGKVEFLSLYGLDYPPGYARGYGEFMLVDRVMESNVIRREPPDTVVWKVTGRYRVQNIARLVRDRPSEFDFYCNCRNLPERQTDQHLQAWRVSAYGQGLRGVYEHFREAETGRYSEQVMRELMDAGRLDSIKVVPRLRHVPVIQGARGKDNQEYGAGLGNRTKMLARRIAIRTMPWLWI